MKEHAIHAFVAGCYFFLLLLMMIPIMFHMTIVFNVTTDNFIYGDSKKATWESQVVRSGFSTTQQFLFKNGIKNASEK